MIGRRCPGILLAVSLLAGAWTAAPAQAPPALPEGLEGEKTPPTAPAPPEGPKLPEGLGETEKPGDREKPDTRTNWLEQWGITGFWEIRGGVRTQHDPHQRDAPIGEMRMQLEFEREWRKLTFKLTADLLYDAVAGRHCVNVETGEGLLDLREASVLFSPVGFMDVKVGRQILTWGTGDLLFINDLFPKDWPSFFVGRDEEYLKAPSDALKISLFAPAVNLDVVYVPRFDADRYLTGRRTSFWRGTLGRRAGRDVIIGVERRSEWFRDDEWAVRLWKNVGGYEFAMYGYWGFWKSPGGMNARGDATFPRLGVYGASARGPVGRGIGNVEFGYYDSRQDRAGENRLIGNSQVRILAGYEQDLPQIARDLAVGVQYYLEWMMDHAAYMRNLTPGSRPADEDRHVVTIRITKKLLSQNLTLSLFAYYSPTDSDAYLRPKISYKIDDHWTVELGGNVFFGKYGHTFFGQLDRNSNVYAALRFGF